jgi:3-dehydroquinate dehydratase-1
VNSPRICGVITGWDSANLANFDIYVDRFVDLFELRIDMAGDGWKGISASLKKPWIACCRIKEEGGKWEGDEASRYSLLLEAARKGAYIVDIELSTEDLREKVAEIKKHSRCLISFHDINGTPDLPELETVVNRQLDEGADICKVITTANSFEDNMTVLELIKKFPGREIVAFAMGEQGKLSRVLCPLAGGSFTYASLYTGKESAPGQITASDLYKIYGMVEKP